jgi:hypothetical protein
MSPEIAGWILAFIFIAVPLIWLAAKLAWWLFRMVFFLCIFLIATAGAAWRGEIR